MHMVIEVRFLLYRNRLPYCSTRTGDAVGIEERREALKPKTFPPSMDERKEHYRKRLERATTVERSKESTKEEAYWR